MLLQTDGMLAFDFNTQIIRRLLGRM